MKTDKVVCVSQLLSDYRPRPVVGEIYIVEGVINGGGDDFYFLKGFDYPMSCGDRVNWRASRFRPVDDSFGEWVQETIMKDVQIEELITQELQ